MNKQVKFGIIIAAVTFPLVVFGQEVELGDAVNSALELAKNYKGLGIIGLASAVISVIMQFLKTDIVGKYITKKGPYYRRAILVTLGQIAGIIAGISSGGGIVDSVITGLIISGGASVIYDAVKPLLKKKKRRHLTAEEVQNVVAKMDKDL